MRLKFWIRRKAPKRYLFKHWGHEYEPRQAVGSLHWVFSLSSCICGAKVTLWKSLPLSLSSFEIDRTHNLLAGAPCLLADQDTEQMRRQRDMDAELARLDSVISELGQR